jgi:hypothetical protein
VTTRYCLFDRVGDAGKRIPLAFLTPDAMSGGALPGTRRPRSVTGNLAVATTLRIETTVTLYQFVT